MQIKVEASRTERFCLCLSYTEIENQLEGAFNGGNRMHSEETMILWNITNYTIEEIAGWINLPAAYLESLCTDRKETIKASEIAVFIQAISKTSLRHCKERREYEFLYELVDCFQNKLEKECSAEYAEAANWVAVQLYTLERQEEAEDAALTSLKIRKDLFGKESREYADACSLVGNLCEAPDCCEEAIAYLEDALRIWKKLGGENCVEVMSCYNDLGIAYGAMGDAEKDRMYMEKALEAAEGMEGAWENERSNLLANVGQGLILENIDSEEGLRYIQQAAEICKQAGKDQELKMATIYRRLANVYWKRNQMREAIENYKKELVLEERILGADCEEVRCTCCDLAQCYLKNSDMENGIRYLKKVLDGIENCPRLVGKRNQEHAANLCFNTGNLCVEYQLKELAQKAYDAGFYHVRNYAGETCRDMADGLDMAAAGYRKLKKTAEAIRCFKEAFKIRQALYLNDSGSEKKEIGKAMWNELFFIANCYVEEKDVTHAIEWFEEAISFSTVIQEKYQESVVIACLTLCALYREIGDQEKAVVRGELAYEIACAIHGKDSMIAAGTSNYVKQCLYPSAMPSRQEKSPFAYVKKNLLRGRIHPVIH